jgi:hypothetical protein
MNFMTIAPSIPSKKRVIPYARSTSNGNPLKNLPCFYFLLRYNNNNSLRPYQLEGLNWLMYCWSRKQNSILADEMGYFFLTQVGQNRSVYSPFEPIVCSGEDKGPFSCCCSLIYNGKLGARNKRMV